MQKITPFLWYNDNALEAMNFYVSVFKNAKIIDAHKLPDGKMLTGTFSIGEQKFMVINGGPMFKFTEAISLFISCEDQTEIDDLWTKLTADGGSESQCGWLKDKYGLSWQVVPKTLSKLLGDPEKGQRAMAALLKMKKISIAELEAA